MIASVNVGDTRVMFAIYNPRSWLTLLYCEWLREEIETKIGNQDRAVVHAWIRERHPELSEVLDQVDAGVPVLCRGGYPVTPGAERFEAPIIAHLKTEANLQRAHTRRRDEPRAHP